MPRAVRLVWNVTRTGLFREGERSRIDWDFDILRRRRRRREEEEERGGGKGGKAK